MSTKEVIWCNGEDCPAYAKLWEEITALRAERDADRYELKRLREALDWGQSERTAARAIARELGVAVDPSDEPGADRHLGMVCRILGALTANISAERDAHKARMGEAVERLKPTAKAAADWNDRLDDESVLWPDSEDVEITVKVGDLRRAAAFIASVDQASKAGQS
jgi:hypothetical protein